MFPKFRVGDRVYISPTIDTSRTHFESDKLATVLEVSWDQHREHGSERIDYALNIDAHGFSAWYPESELSWAPLPVTVKPHDEVGATGNISAISLVYRSLDVIILHVDLHAKHAKVSAFNGETDPDVSAFWIGGDEVQVTLPAGFERYRCFAESNRYSIFVTYFRFDLLEQMSRSERSILWGGK